MSELVLQPENTSCHLYEGVPNTNFSEAYFYLGSTTDKNSHPLLRHNFTVLPDGAIISQAILSLLCFDKNGDPVGRTYLACEITQREWIATQATWNIYKTSNNWASAGGDFITDDAGSCVVPSDPIGKWFDFDVTTLIQHFQSAHGKISELLLKDNSEDSGAPDLGCYFRSNWYAEASRPKLFITYTLPSAPSKTFVMIF